MVARKCSVPSCSYRVRKNDPNRRSMFQCPKDEQKARRWASYIPGIEFLLANQAICEIHFEPRFIRRYTENNSSRVRSRLKNDAVPTIFFDLNVHEMSIRLFENSVNNDPKTNSYLDNGMNNHVQPTTAEASLQDIVKDLSASEQLLMNIKQEYNSIPEEEMSKIKLENSEVKEENDIGAEELTVYEQLQNNLNYYITLLPESWSVNQLLIGTDRVFAFSKECTVKENQGLVVMYEKNIVLNINGNMHYSVHGRKVKVNESDTPDTLNDIESLIKIVVKFNELKVCQGICTREFEVDKDCTIYTDDLGYSRHVNCTLIADTQQCNYCYEYSQYLLTMLVNNAPVLNNESVYFYNRVY